MSIHCCFLRVPKYSLKFITESINLLQCDAAGSKFISHHFYMHGEQGRPSATGLRFCKGGNLTSYREGSSALPGHGQSWDLGKQTKCPKQVINTARHSQQSILLSSDFVIFHDGYS